MQRYRREQWMNCRWPTTSPLLEPADLAFSDCMHRLISLDGSHAPSAERNPRLAVMRFLMNRWSCSMMLFM